LNGKELPTTTKHRWTTCKNGLSSDIYQHLSEIIYNATQDTYITILDTTPDKDVRLFREELKKCYMHSFSSNNELYTEEKYEQVKRMLDRFASMENVDREWTNAVTDVRQWFEFNASERFRADNSEKEFYEGSGGKSGGQKEKRAYTILASALAYQFGLQFGESKSRRFRFGGFNVSYLRNAEWLGGRNIFYWGDIDEHGLQILQQLRGYYPNTKSVMMNLQTFHLFNEYAVDGQRIKTANLTLLTQDEALLFQHLKSLDQKNRLEQEKIPQKYVNETLFSLLC